MWLNTRPTWLCPTDGGRTRQMSDDRKERAVARALSTHEHAGDLEERRVRPGRAGRFTQDDLRRAQRVSANAAQYVERAAQHLEQAYQYVQLAQKNAAAIHRFAAEFYERHDQPAAAKTHDRQAAENESGGETDQ